MRRAILAGIALAATGGAAIADSPAIPVDPAPYMRLSCAAIRGSILALNGPIGDANNSWIQLRVNPNLPFILFGVTNPAENAALAFARGERNALIAAAVAKNCAAEWRAFGP